MLANGGAKTSFKWGAGGVQFNDTCPPGQVIRGFFGRAGAYVDSVGIHCGELRLSRSGTSYSVTVRAAVNRPAGGGGGGYTLDCPAGYAVSGIRGRAGNVIDRVGIVCRQVRVSGSIGSYRVSAVNARDRGSVGGNGGTPLAYDCRGTRLDTGGSPFVNALRLVCETVQIRYSEDGRSPRTFEGRFSTEAT